MAESHLLEKIKLKYHDIPVQAKLAMWILICTVIQKGISLITVPVFTRLMDTTEYGKVSIYFSWVNIASIITSFKLNAGVYNKGLSKFKEDRDGYCLSMQYTTTFFTVALLFVCLIFRDAVCSLTELSFGLILLMFVELLFNTSMGFWTVKKQYEFKYKQIVAGTLVLTFLNPLLGVLFVVNAPYEQRGTARILSTVLAISLVGLFFYIINMKQGKYKYKFAYTKFAVLFNIPLIPHYFSEYILNQSDRIMIQKMCSLSDVAFYSVAYNAGMLLTIITSSLNQALTPWLYQSLDDKNYCQIGKTIMSLAALIMVPLIIFICLAPEAIYILAGDKYASAVYVIPPVAGSIVFLFLYTNFANIEFYYDYNKFTMYISMIGAILNLALNYVFINLFGFVAAGYTTFACFFVYCFGHYLFMEFIMKKKNHVHLIDIKMLLGLVIVLLALMITMSLTYSSILLRYSLICLLLAFVFVFRKRICSILLMIKKVN